MPFLHPGCQGNHGDRQCHSNRNASFSLNCASFQRCSRIVSPEYLFYHVLILALMLTCKSAVLYSNSKQVNPSEPFPTIKTRVLLYIPQRGSKKFDILKLKNPKSTHSVFFPLSPPTFFFCGVINASGRQMKTSSWVNSIYLSPFQMSDWRQQIRQPRSVSTDLQWLPHSRLQYSLSQSWP